MGWFLGELVISPNQYTSKNMRVESTSYHRPNSDAAEDDSRSLFSGKSVLSNNHKVVAMPHPSTLGDMSGGRDTASTRTGRSRGGRSTGRSRSPRRIRRSNSAGRTVNRSRDLIQDVYDRMGVNYTAGRSSMSNYGNEEAGHMSNLEPAQGRSIHDIARGRKEAAESAEKETRQRSLSRGRAAQAWSPMKKSREDQAESTTASSYTPSKYIESSGQNTVASSRSYHRASYGGAAATAPRSGTKKSAPTRSMSATSKYTPEGQASFSPYMYGRQESSKPAVADESRDEQYSSNESSSKEEFPKSDLARDRLSAVSDKRFSSSQSVGGGSASLRKIRPSYAGGSSPKPSQFKKRELPPKIDIYGKSKPTGAAKVGDEEKSVATKASIGLEARRFSSANSVSGASVGSHNTRRSIGDSYLAAISPSAPSKPKVPKETESQKSLPVVEINPSDEHMGGDNLTLASSVSGDEFEMASSRKQPGGHDVVSTSVSKPGAYKYGASQKSKNLATDVSSDMAKVIQEEVRLRTAELEGRILKLEMQLVASNNDSQKLAAMEEKMNKMNEMINHMMSYR